MNFYTSDLHFDHKNILRLCNRPFNSIEDMNDSLIKNWNDRIANTDDVYILGDICFDFNRFIYFLEKLNGNKHIVLGNHDPKNIQTANIKNTDFLPLIYTCYDNNHKIELCHYPIFEWNGFYRGCYHFYGHVHGTRKSHHDHAFEVGVDVQNYIPKTFDEIVNNK